MHAFTRLVLEDWRQFGEMDLQFHPQLTVLTGANATGKSTILGVLGRHFNWPRNYSTAPVRYQSPSGTWGALTRREARRMIAKRAYEIGRLVYGTGVDTAIAAPESSGDHRAQYDLVMPQQQPLDGIYINSHRSVQGNYAKVENIPADIGSAGELLQDYNKELHSRWAGTFSKRSPQLALKQALISAALLGGRGNPYVDAAPSAIQLWEGFHEVLYHLLPPTLEFRRLVVRMPEIVIETDTGDFIIDEASGGLSAIIEMGWQIYLQSVSSDNFCVLIDEPENHLHPSLQRELMPALVRSFPRAQFIVATHSPFVVTAVPNSFVYALRYSQGTRSVYAERLDYANKAASANDTLTDVLGLDSAGPLWADKRFEAIVESFTSRPVTEESMLELRDQLAQAGLAKEFPDALIRIMAKGLV